MILMRVQHCEENKCLLMILTCVQQTIDKLHQFANAACNDVFWGCDIRCQNHIMNFAVQAIMMSSFRPRRFGSDTILQSIPRSRRTIHSFHRMHHDWNIHSSRTYLSSSLQHCNFQLGICTAVYVYR